VRPTAVSSADDVRDRRVCHRRRAAVATDQPTGAHQQSDPLAAGRSPLRIAPTTATASGSAVPTVTMRASSAAAGLLDLPRSCAAHTIRTL
jgi:hypothetical protein